MAGFVDFKRGTFENCKAFEIDGIPTIVSIGTGACRWLSQIYQLPVPGSFDLAAWELAATQRPPTGRSAIRSNCTGGELVSLLPLLPPQHL